MQYRTPYILSCTVCYVLHTVHPFISYSAVLAGHNSQSHSAAADIRKH